jgi:ankyrin repeat protein
MAALESELFLAVKNQDIGKVAALLKRGVSSNAHLEDEWTCLHEAATTGPAELLEMLIKHGANLETKGGDKLLTPLHVAALHG